MMCLWLSILNVLRHANLELLRIGWEAPTATDDELRSRLIYHALNYSESRVHSLNDCGMKVVKGEQWMMKNICVIEVFDKAVRERFGFSEYHLFIGPPALGERTSSLANAPGYNTFEEAAAAYDFYQVPSQPAEV